MITAEHLQELQRFAELGRMSASLLHEISNPLTAALLNLELSDERSASVRRARRDIKLLRRVLDPLASQAGVRLDIGAVPNCRLHGDPVKFQHIISNLVVNAIEAYSTTDRYDCRLVRITFTQRRNRLSIQVVDWATASRPRSCPTSSKRSTRPKPPPATAWVSVWLS